MHPLIASPRAVQLARRLGLDANPLRRAADRAEAWLRIGVLVALLVGGPLAAIGSGLWAYHAGQHEARAQAARLHTARAVLLKPVPLLLGGSGDDGQGEAWVRARWPVGSGASRTGEILATMGLPAGSAVTVWLNPAGQLAGPPLRPAQVTSRAIAVAALTPAVLSVLLLTVLLLIQYVLDKRRLAAWDAAWLAVEPRWSGQRP